MELVNNEGERRGSEVAQIANLLYRRLPTCRACYVLHGFGRDNDLPIGNRRYSRLETCATRADAHVGVFAAVVQTANALKARSSWIIISMLLMLLLPGCSTSRTAKAPPTSTVTTRHVDEIRLVAVPMALNFDRQPGPDGFAVKVYGLNHGSVRPQEIRQGAIQLFMFDGVLIGTNAIEPLCTWTYSAGELRQYEMNSTIGLAYQFAPRWGDKRPNQNRFTVVARYNPDGEKALESAPSVISVGQQ